MRQIIIFILLLTVAASCQTTKVPGQLVWDYEYRHVYPDTLADSLKYLYKMSKYDSANVQFLTKYRLTQDTTGLDTTMFDTLGYSANKVHEYYILQHKELYIDKTFSFVCQAVLIDSTGRQYNQSAHSDTIYVFIPVLPIGRPIELISVELPLGK
jgi:hypothetical protein